MDKAPSAISQVPVFMQAPGVYTSFTRQLAAPWSPNQGYYGDFHASQMHMKQQPDPSASNQLHNKDLEIEIATSHPILNLPAEVDLQKSLQGSTLGRNSGSGSSESSATLTPTCGSSGESSLKTISRSLGAKLSSAPKKKKKKAKKPSLKAALNSELPTMVPPLIDVVEKQHQCPDCPRRFSWQFQLQQHSRTHSGERPFVCPDCQQAYKRREHLQRHQRIHTGERPFKCEACEKKYRRKSQLVRHARVHTGERPYDCVVCEKNFRRRGHLLRHLKVHTPEVLKEAGINLLDISKVIQDSAARVADKDSGTLAGGMPQVHPDQTPMPATVTP